MHSRKLHLNTLGLSYNKKDSSLILLFYFNQDQTSVCIYIFFFFAILTFTTRKKKKGGIKYALFNRGWWSKSRLRGKYFINQINIRFYLYMRLSDIMSKKI